MSLGERRRKQIIVPDPRNKNWTHDDSKFGHKLMEKMGWTDGKGLGLKEQGMSTSIALRMKPNTTTKGLDCNKETLEAWESGGKDFDSLLAQLNKGETIITSSVESRSIEKSTTARLRYRKRVKNKDVSSYSSKDMQSILGRRKRTNSRNDDVIPLSSECKIQPIKDDQEPVGKNMNDYFTSKMKDKLKRHKLSV